MKKAAEYGGKIDGLLASWTQSATTSAMQDALRLSARPGIINFSLGLPSPELFPSGRLKNACVEMLSSGSKTLQYGRPSEALRSHIVSLMRIRGVECDEQQVFLTSGAQQGVHLIVALLLERGRELIAEELCYPGFKQTVDLYKPKILTVPTDPKTGMSIEKIEWYLARGARPAFIYSIPDGHNPLGVTLSEEKRKGLLALSREYGIPIIEEDPYGFLSYQASPIKPMRAQEENLVFYVGSFSKILAPSLRVGWLVAPKELMANFAILKESSDIDTATFSQHVVACMLDTNFLPAHLERLRLEYKHRRDTMSRVLAERFPAGCEWSRPDSGVFVWVRLPELFDTLHLLETAVMKYGVAFIPGSAFSVTGQENYARSCMRLNFSRPSVSEIETGLLRLGEMLVAD